MKDSNLSSNILFTVAVALHLLAATLMMTTSAKADSYEAGKLFGENIPLVTVPWKPLGFGDDDSLGNTGNLFKKNPKLRGCKFELRATAGYMWAYFNYLVFTCVRSVEEQKKMVKEGKSKTFNSRHLVKFDPGRVASMAVDIVQLDTKGKARWNDRELHAYFAGAFIAVFYRLAEEHDWEYDLRWGGNFRMDCVTYKGAAWDQYHFALYKDRAWSCAKHGFEDQEELLLTEPIEDRFNEGGHDDGDAGTDHEDHKGGEFTDKQPQRDPHEHYQQGPPWIGPYPFKQFSQHVTLLEWGPGPCVSRSA